MYLDNNWYGNRFILSKYCNTKDTPALASIQHGMLLSKFYESDPILEKKVFGKRSFSLFFPWLIWNDILFEKTQEFKSKNVVTIGAPIIYLDKIFKKKKFSKPKGTLIFPSKSAWGVNMEVDYSKIYNYIKKKYKPPFTIVVSYFDLKRIFKIRHDFKNCKFVTFGKRNNKFFTLKLYKYLREHQSTVSFYPGSPILYSLFLRKKTYYFPKRFLKNVSGKFFTEKNTIELKKIKKEDILIENIIKKEYSIDLSNLNKKKDFINADIALGKNRMKNPKFIKKILGWDSIFKIILGILLYYIMNLKNYFNPFLPRRNNEKKN